MKGKIALFVIVSILLVFLLSSKGGVGYGIIVGVVSASAAGLLCSIVLQLHNAHNEATHRLYARDFSLKLVATLMCFFLMVGTLLFLVVFHSIASIDVSVLPAEEQARVSIPKFTNAEYLFRSMVSALNLFMFNLDSNVLDRLDDFPFLKGCLSVCTVLSSSCTLALLTGLVYYRLKAYCRLTYRTKIDQAHNHLYLFFGSNVPTYHLLKGIKENDPQAVTVIVDKADLREDNKDEWEGIISYITHRRRVFEEAGKYGANVAIAGEQLNDIGEEVYSRPDFDAFGYLGLNKVRKCIKQLGNYAGSQLHILFMDEDEELNIRNIRILVRDASVAAVANNAGIEHRIYCHARYNGPNRIIEDVALQRKMNIKIIDSSHIAIEILKFDSTCHPVNVMKLDNDNPVVVKSEFTALIIGFGEVGRDAFRFLYEYGHFLEEDGNVSAAGCLRNAPFECTVVDKELDCIEGILKTNMPGIFGKRDANTKISFKNIDYRSEDFYSEVLNDDFARRLNYVVISIGDNDEAIALAARIFGLLRKQREKLDNLRIFVRCTDDKLVEGIQRIADHYNYGYGQGMDNEPVIRIFGQPQKTYTYDLVISNRLVNLGKEYHRQYVMINGEGKSWDERHNQFAETVPPDINKLRKLRRQESQDIANALHVGTKLYLLRKALGENYDWFSFCSRYMNADGTPIVEGSHNSIVYPRLTEKENLTIRRLSMLEHLRWNCAHELMGYVYNDEKHECDERTMKHNCLCSWKMLDEESKATGYDYKKYDYCVVDTSISLWRNVLINGKHG